MDGLVLLCLLMLALSESPNSHQQNADCQRILEKPRPAAAAAAWDSGLTARVALQEDFFRRFLSAPLDAEIQV